MEVIKGKKCKTTFKGESVNCIMTGNKTRSKCKETKKDRILVEVSINSFMGVPQLIYKEIKDLF